MTSAGPEPGWYFDPDGKSHQATTPPGLGRRSDQNDELDSSPTQNPPGQARNADSLYHPTTRASITDPWHRLTKRNRIALLSVPTLALVIALITAATGVLAPRGPLDKQWVRTTDQ